MGLDMFLYKYRKLTNEEKEALKNNVFTEDHLDKNGYTYFRITTHDDDFHLVSGLYYAGFLHPAKVMETELDMDAVRGDYNIPDDARIVGYRIRPEGSNYTFRWLAYDKSTRERDISLSAEEIEDKYTLEVMREMFVGASDMVSYWRKYYDLQDHIYELLDETIENCGYYAVNEDQLESIFDFIKADSEFNHVDEEMPSGPPHYDPDREGIFYHEWY